MASPVPEEEKDSLANVRINAYSHNVQNIPPYVLDTLSSVHYKDELNNSNVNTVGPAIWHTNQPPGWAGKNDDVIPFNPYVQDDYVNRLGNNWHNLVNSVRDPQARPDYKLDENILDDRLQGTWGGDKRLKEALLGEDVYDDVESDNGNHKRRHRKPGYWLQHQNRKTFLESIQSTILYNRWLPLIFRILLVTCCCCALGMACTIFRGTKKYIEFGQEPSTIMAICVQSIALAYLLYIAYDEFTGKPLGLRNASAKLLYILLDLVFIIFSSANVSLAFNTLYDSRWVCREDVTGRVPVVTNICRRQRALTGFLVMVIFFWLVNFCLSTTRVIVKFTNASR
ncbi:hypothetical protein DIURU_000878 [Diutina rugosa]|uniref:Uncharacterized protein n=1 Tax=Diutina rugosa TaxID=5481 RepID=A0A642UYZ5_DIURU|nr:uncharacterized protein DIURU_000878 [Diutina rugosa]KAA8907194.1 hypothetical protein DIURU_000878 [Diutina rugosa]